MLTLPYIWGSTDPPNLKRMLSLEEQMKVLASSYDLDFWCDFLKHFFKVGKQDLF